MYDLEKSFYELFGKRKPLCESCQFRKIGLTTICEQYKRIPSSVQQGGFCEKYAKEIKRC